MVPQDLITAIMRDESKSQGSLAQLFPPNDDYKKIQRYGGRKK
jgi:hypothetical protein